MTEHKRRKRYQNGLRGMLTCLLSVVILVAVGTYGTVAFMNLSAKPLPETVDQSGAQAAVQTPGAHTGTNPGETNPAEPKPEDTKPDEQTKAERANVLLAEAKTLAAGYDYDKALATIEAYPDGDWESNEALKEAHDHMTEEKAALVKWPDTTTIPHIFFHSLIVDTDRCFDGDSTSDGYNLYMCTVGEFKQILQEMYDRGFVLVTMYDMAPLIQNADGTSSYGQGEILLPEGKKPFILSQDDVNYYMYMVDGDGDGFADKNGDGFATKLVVDASGNLACDYITADGQTLTGAYDMVPILEEFIQSHPDFSYRGARAIVGVTGYEGALGYRTHPKYEEILGHDAYEKEVADAKKVAASLKEHGYQIASHSHGHPAFGQITSEHLAEDTQKWENQVQPIVGDADIILYPHGSDIAGLEGYSGAKFDTLYAAGFRYFCNVDSAEYWVQIHDTYVRQGRRNIDGYRMWHNPGLLDDLFDVDAVFDPARPTPVPSI